MLDEGGKRRSQEVGYGVIHDVIFDSSVADDWRARVVLQDMVILANPADKVMMTVKRFLRRTGLPEDVVLPGLESLEGPDPDDKSGQHEGRRLLPIFNPETEAQIGWFVVNREHYKNLMKAQWKRQYQREWMREKRAGLPGRRTRGQEEASANSAKASKVLDQEFGPKASR